MPGDPLHYNDGWKAVSNHSLEKDLSISITISVNGEVRQVRAGLTVLELLAALDVDPARVAVELNREIVRKPAWNSTMVEDGAALEIVQFVGGG
jgi:thiamine biosynthesis protein ThiS